MGKGGGVTAAGCTSSNVSALNDVKRHSRMLGRHPRAGILLRMSHVAVGASCGRSPPSALGPSTTFGQRHFPVVDRMALCPPSAQQQPVIFILFKQQWEKGSGLWRPPSWTGSSRTSRAGAAPCGGWRSRWRSPGTAPPRVTPPPPASPSLAHGANAAMSGADAAVVQRPAWPPFCVGRGGRVAGFPPQCGRPPPNVFVSCPSAAVPHGHTGPAIDKQRCTALPGSRRRRRSTSCGRRTAWSRARPS